MPPAPPTCPRCGYDQTGAIASWNREDSPSCPLRGTCSECGLEFRWHDVICADRLIVHGFVEHARGFWQTWRWAWVTWAWTLWPPVFWRKVRMEHAPQMKWCVLWMVLLIAPAHALVAGSENIALLRKYQELKSAPATRSPPFAYQSPPPQLLKFPWARVPAPWCAPLADIGNPRWDDTWSRINATSARWSVRLDVGLWPPFVPVCATASVTIGLVLAVLPATRRAARVRAVHAWRAFIYGCAWIIPPILLWEIRAGAAAYEKLAKVPASGWVDLGFGARSIWWVSAWRAPSERPYVSMFTHPMIWIAASLAWVILWWSRAIAEMFRDHALRPVLRATVIAGSLAACVALIRTTEALEWLVNLPGASWLYPPK